MLQNIQPIHKSRCMFYGITSDLTIMRRAYVALIALAIDMVCHEISHLLRVYSRYIPRKYKWLVDISWYTTRKRGITSIYTIWSQHPGVGYLSIIAFCLLDYLLIMKGETNKHSPKSLKQNLLITCLLLHLLLQICGAGSGDSSVELYRLIKSSFPV